MGKFEVGYEGELIGTYFGDSAQEAIAACKADVAWNFGQAGSARFETPPNIHGYY